MRSQASASSRSVPAKHEPSSMSANRLREVTSRRLKARRRAADRLADEPVVLQRLQRRVHRERGRWIALGLDQPHADVELVGAHREDRVLELARQRQRIPGGAGGLDRRDVLRLMARRPLDGEGRGALGAVDRDRDMGVARARPRSIARSSGVSATPFAPSGRSLRSASASARARTASANSPGLAIASTSRQSTAFCPRTPSLVVQKTSARSWRTWRLSVRRVRPPVPGSTPSSGTSGRLTALDRSSIRRISSQASASS